jgi:hypothetical protein
MPYDPEQVARQQAEQRAYEKASAGRAAGAAKSPLRSGGGGGFQSAGKSPSFQTGADPTYDAPSGTSKGVIHTEAQEQSVRGKVAAGKPLTQEDL